QWWTVIQDFGLPPGPAIFHVPRARFLVKAPLAAFLPIKMLDGVGNVNLLAPQSGGLYGLVQQPARRTDERLARLVLAISRHFAPEHGSRSAPPSATHGLP